MKLYVLRHGEAATTAASDSERPLTDTGANQTSQVVQRRLGHLSGLEAVFSSPKLRAVQTAEIVRKLLTSTPAITTTELIKPNADLAALGNLMDQFTGNREVMLVSHQPFVGELIDYLTDKPGTGTLMRTSCLACLDVITYSRGCATLEWLEIP